MRIQTLPVWSIAGALAVGSLAVTVMSQGPDQVQPTDATEAPAGFDNQSNGLVDAVRHQSDRTVFEEVDNIGDGLGPVFNAQSCRECHQSPTTGAASQVRELRAGHLDAAGTFVPATVPIGDGTATIAGRSLINQRSICPGVDTVTIDGHQVPFNFPDTAAYERVPARENIRALRASLNTLGDGFVEAIADSTLLAIAADQCDRSGGTICGQAVMVQVLERDGATGIGRFGWKDQHASLLSFSADAYLNEMGITSRLLPNDVTPLCDIVPDPESITPDEEGLQDVDHFARFMRATKAPPRDAHLKDTARALAGERLFQQVGCAFCHVSQIVTAPAGTPVAGGAFEVPPALGNKIIHPFSDFLLHDVGTGDGIVQTGGQETSGKLRTPPLWGARTRTELMHDGGSVTFSAAILRHRGEAAQVIERFKALTATERSQIIVFLKSL